MAIPVDNRTMAQRLKTLEAAVARLSGNFAGATADLDDTIYDPSGNLVVSADYAGGVGLLKPRLSATVTAPSDVTTITSGTMVEAFTVAVRRQNPQLEVRFTAICDAGTTANVRAIIASTATELMAPVAIASGATLMAAWTLSIPGAWDDYVLVEIQGQRSGGAGNLKIRPYSVAGG